MCSTKGLTWTTAQFVEKAMAVHGDLYDYTDTQAERAAAAGARQEKEAEEKERKKAAKELKAAETAARLTAILRAGVLNTWAVQPAPNWEFTETIYTEIASRPKIVCRVPGHGEFHFRAQSVPNGSGCLKCGARQARIIKTSSTSPAASSLQRIRLLRPQPPSTGPNYGYTKLVYQDSVTSITVTCNVHGDITMLPRVLLEGAGCRLCGIERMRDANRKPMAEFKAEAEAVHGRRYDYSNVEHTKPQNKRNHWVFPARRLSAGAGRPSARKGIQRVWWEQTYSVWGAL
ncbi:hypothetical protein DFS34DRAFT_677885 [Phlyctochytrium arcticum]|nr:hypothetical protein DFS34DRAFT_677885 [Phlyctochytrium arcticum]